MKYLTNGVVGLMACIVGWSASIQTYAGENAAVSSQESATTGQPQPTIVSAPAEQIEAAMQPSRSPIAGAFGLPLGEKFEPCMVVKILAQEEHDYTGADKTKHTGKLYHVEPKVPSRYFNQYEVKTTEAGIIYTIQGRFESAARENLCQQTKHLAALLEGKYGKPRGRGMLGEWYTFLGTIDGPYRGLKFYAPKCRAGRYMINYVDEGAKAIEASPQQDLGGMTGL